MRRKLKEEISRVSLNLSASLETARAGLEQLRSEELLDADKTADCLELLIRATAKQNNRLQEIINH